MKTCPNCHFENPDESAFCSNCGAPMNGQPAYQPPCQPMPKPWDHTEDYEEEDILSHRLLALSCYVLGIPGILIALLAGKESQYLQFHIQEALKFSIVDVILGFLGILLCWTFVVPIAAGVLLAILLISRAIAIVDVCRNKVMEPFLIRSLKFLSAEPTANA